MTRRIVLPPPKAPTRGTKDGTGAFLPPEPENVDVSLDGIHEAQLLILKRETERLKHLSSIDLLSRDEGTAFERCVKVLREFKKEERELVESMKDHEVEDAE